MTVDEARALAEWAHAGQTDLFGRPFVEHVVAVAGLASPQAPDEVRVVALLHDVVEKGDATFDDLRDAGASAEIVAAVDALSHRPGERTEQYLSRCAANPMARLVKRLDLLEKLDPALLARLSDREAAALRGQVEHRLAVLETSP